ncbi:uncharacterized protein PADG_02265 [Paracoccidioides brasiliensis Pb18]|uniref:Mid2 domain-containing protein n=1 Tax=Paracoccidioides brasiliensis (strain Pb18) TaxID=502780 RepID=C1G299_PARBD|nr:uncharacterized protein PADG_02265 [Paracoccidioides brasiliensis Pb18]EEH46115.2 hypothetical protein PADG_02265 [Paracoccidioides brasiliensis Pb18]
MMMMRGMMGVRPSLILALSLFALLEKNFSNAEDAPMWFNGYYVFHKDGSTSTESITCGNTDSAWITSGTYAGCCKISQTTPCAMATNCLDGTVQLQYGRTYTCQRGASCQTMTVYETSPFGSPSATNIFCWQDWKAYTVYRTLPVEVTATTTKLPSITPPPQRSPLSTAASSSSPTLPSQKEQENPQSSNKPSSGVIAGGTIGGVAGITIVGFGLFFFRRNQKRSKIAMGIGRGSELDSSQMLSELGDGPSGAGAVVTAKGYYAPAVAPQNERDIAPYLKANLSRDRLTAAHEMPANHG